MDFRLQALDFTERTTEQTTHIYLYNITNNLNV